MPSTTQCQNPEPVGASGSKQVTAKLLVSAGKPDQYSDGEMFPPVMPNPSKTWLPDIISPSATSSLRRSNDGTGGMKSYGSGGRPGLVIEYLPPVLSHERSPRIRKTGGPPRGLA